MMLTVDFLNYAFLLFNPELEATSITNRIADTCRWCSQYCIIISIVKYMGYKQTIIQFHTADYIFQYDKKKTYE